MQQSTRKEATSVRLLRDGWTFCELDPPSVPNSNPAAWLPAVVPGLVHLDLMREGAIPDPFERMHERAVQWVDERDWAYRCTFDVAEDEASDARHLLRFDGLDTVATVLLNDSVIGETDNMFVAHEFDVTSALRVGANVLEVRLASAQRVGDQRREAWLDRDPDRDAYRTSRGLTARSMVRKAQYMYGWDWGPRLRSCGIWQDVSLVRIPHARVGDWSWTATFATDGSCRVGVRVWVDGDAAEVQGRITGHGADLEARVAVDDGRAELGFTIDGPQRWWPAGHGDQPLYDLGISVVAASVSVDAVTARIGLREVELVREPDEFGESFFFRVNGRPVFAKGANWIPDDSFPTRTTTDRVRALVTLARDCGMNMLRIWGGGLYESDAFYDACAELGIMVWQDFPFACGFYPEDDWFVDAAAAEAGTAVRRLRNHTALVLYCGNNESQWLTGMGAYGAMPKVLGERLYDETLPGVVEREDPTRPYWPGSPFGQQPDVNGESDGDCHYWNVWHGEGDWRHYTKCQARFVSEFGFSGPPNMRTLEEVLEPSDIGVDTPAMRWHDKTSKGYDTYLGFIGLHYPPPVTAADLVYYGQLNQADAMRFGIEHFRRLRPRTMGTLVWQLNDCWPVQSWAWVDYGLRPKAAWYAAKRFYAPLLLSLWRDGDRIGAHLVNDGTDEFTGDLHVRGLTADGVVAWETTVAAAVGAGTSVVAFDTELPGVLERDAASVIVHSTFAGVEASLLLVEPKELEMAAPTISASTADAEGAVVLHLATDRVAVSVMLWLEGADASWSDNFFTLLPETRRDIRVEPWSAMTAAEVHNRLRWRTLND